MLNTFLEGNLKGAGADCPYMSKDELAGKNTNLAKEKAFSGIQGNKMLVTFRRWGRQLRKSMRMSLGHIERKLE